MKLRTFISRSPSPSETLAIFGPEYLVELGGDKVAPDSVLNVKTILNVYTSKEDTGCVLLSKSCV